jgi:hypothetical protein
MRAGQGMGFQPENRTPETTVGITAHFRAR